MSLVSCLDLYIIREASRGKARDEGVSEVATGDAEYQLHLHIGCVGRAPPLKGDHGDKSTMVGKRTNGGVRVPTVLHQSLRERVSSVIFHQRHKTVSS